MYDLEGSKKLLSSTEDSQFSRIWRIQGQNQGLDSRSQDQRLRKLFSRQGRL